MKKKIEKVEIVRGGRRGSLSHRAARLGLFSALEIPPDRSLYLYACLSLTHIEPRDAITYQPPLVCFQGRRDGQPCGGIAIQNVDKLLLFYSGDHARAPARVHGGELSGDDAAAAWKRRGKTRQDTPRYQYIAASLLRLSHSLSLLASPDFPKVSWCTVFHFFLSPSNSSSDSRPLSLVAST